MIRAKTLLTHLLFLTIAIFSGPLQAKLSLTEKVLLQSAMQQHVDQAAVDGAFLHLNTKSGAVRALQQEESHPMIIRMGKYFVLCASFRDEKGEHVNVDFYLAPRDKNYVVFQSVVENREILQRLMKKGEASRVE